MAIDFTYGPKSNTGKWNTWHLAPSVVHVCQHELRGELLRYDDGILAGYCLKCHERFILSEVPLGDLPALVRGLLAELVASSDVSDFLLERTEVCRHKLEEAERSVREAQEVLRLIDAVLEKR